MSRRCPSSIRQHAERTARLLRSVEYCTGVDVLDPREGSRAEWTLEATFTGTDVIPAAAVQVLADADCGIVSMTRRGPGVYQLVAEF